MEDFELGLLSVCRIGHLIERSASEYVKYLDFVGAYYSTMIND
jgi:hypothetical protein